VKNRLCGYYEKCYKNIFELCIFIFVLVILMSWVIVMCGKELFYWKVLNNSLFCNLVKLYKII